MKNVKIEYSEYYIPDDWDRNSVLNIPKELKRIKYTLALKTNIGDKVWFYNMKANGYMDGVVSFLSQRGCNVVLDSGKNMFVKWDNVLENKSK